MRFRGETTEKEGTVSDIDRVIKRQGERERERERERKKVQSVILIE